MAVPLSESLCLGTCDNYFIDLWKALMEHWHLYWGRRTRCALTFQIFQLSGVKSQFPKEKKRSTVNTIISELSVKMSKESRQASEKTVQGFHLEAKQPVSCTFREKHLKFCVLMISFTLFQTSLFLPWQLTAVTPGKEKLKRTSDTNSHQEDGCWENIWGEYCPES